ncbi:MAG: MOSC N-terminal beta barrel domain-containing protein [Halioglobus sp.]
MANAVSPEVRVTGLYCYPVKSMRGVSLTASAIGFQGLANDRRWMVVDDEGCFLTQREQPRLALIVPSLGIHDLTLTGPDGGQFSIPYEESTGEVLLTRVWGEDCRVLEVSVAASDWLTESVGSKRGLRLVKMEPNSARAQSHPEIFGEDTHVLFADAAPVLICSEASLLAVNTRLAENGASAVPMDRFRPNIVVSGLSEFEEHRLDGLNGPGFELRFRVHCERCVVTTIDQLTAVRNPNGEPFRTVRELNTPDGGKKPVFGHYATLESGEGYEVTVGDVLTIRR